ncbi:MAG: hypothetical protein A2V77_04205 [Anaeromyxobacter sp. RBG_16_69_14]|nr:MAG: hypothetical protein A2V77_04205 [Anaeromyxobacter sp. RBG_16_69_14]
MTTARSLFWLVLLAISVGLACGCAQLCTAGNCVCPAGKTVCAGVCVDTQTSAANCGACGKKCPTGQACAGGACACTSGLTCGGTCCAAGDACCATGCQIQHDNGQGQTFFDCNAAGSEAAALDAAKAFDPDGALAVGQDGLTCSFSAECVAWLTSGVPQSCAVWCFAGTAAGKTAVTQSINCLCPDPIASVSWH